MPTTLPTERGDFLPDLCTVQAVFHLVLVGELLAIALTLFDRGLVNFNWNLLGLLSMLIQWIMLCSAACLCPLRPWLRRCSPLLAGLSSYLVVLAITLFFSLLSSFMHDDAQHFMDRTLSHLLIAAVFAGIVLRYFYLQQQVRNQQQAELNARIQALQARIRPHFLFNSMNSIASLIDYDPPSAEKMIVDLCELFRASLSEPGLVPLQQEIDLCQRFISIEQTRLGSRLKVDWHMDAVPDTEIPGLLLQPLIENAIFHGIQPLQDGGTIRIVVEEVAGACRINITNPINSGAHRAATGHGLALDNIRHRLSAHFGKKASMTAAVDDHLYHVALVLPLQRPKSVTGRNENKT